VEVTVSRLTLVAWDAPLVTVEAEVSAGTYIRAIARDLGELLGTGACTESLRRDRIGPWVVDDAVELERLTGREPLLPPLTLLAGLPEVALTADELPSVRLGRDVERPGPTAGEAALVELGRLVAVGRAVPNGWHPAVVLPPPEDA
jgi:tRNA pseudouridine55 synthase